MKKIITSFCALAGLFTFSHAQTALDFDGNDDIVVAGNQISTDLVGVNTFTVEAWVNSSTTTGLGVVVGNYNYPVNNGQMQFLLRRDNDQYGFWIDDGDITGNHVVQSGAGTVLTGQWQHVVGVWDGSEIRIYIDGVLLNTNTITTGPGFPSYLNDLVLGNNVFTEAFTGQIDNIRIWTDVRTDTEINDFMSCEVTTNTPGLLASYHFNDGLDGGANATNTLLFDNSGNGYHGTLQNFALTGASSNFTTSNRTDYMSIQASLGSSAMADRTSPRQAGDFNGDGFDDIIALTEAGTHDIYYSDGFGHFETPVAIPNPIGGGYDVADIDNDGDIDMINYGGAQFKVYVNDGAGNFTELTPVALDGTGGINVARIGDVNGDNLPDVITGNNGTGVTDLNEIWINSGTVGNPSFTFLEGLNSTYGSISSIAIGDIDNDNFVDLAFSFGAGAAVVHNNDNNTTYPQGQVVGGYNSFIRFIDWNQDGHLDLVSSDGYNNWGVRVFYNNTTGTFLTTGVVAVSIGGGIDYFSYAPVRYADINGDGFMDVVTRYWGGSGAGLFLSNGCALTLQSGCQYKLGPADNGVAVGDFNGDGTQDVFCGARDRKSSVSLNFLTPVTTPALSDITSTTGDEVCDGDPISIEATASNTGTLLWFSNSDGSTQVGTGSPFSPTAGPGTYEYYVGSENPNGCKSLLDTVEVIVNENPVASVTSTAETNGNDGSIDLTPTGGTSPYSYAWTGPNGFTSMDQDPTGLEGGTYEVTITDDNGCSFVTQVTVDSFVGLEEVESASFNVYPNPSNGNFTIDTPQSGKLNVLSTNGQIIHSTTIKSGKTNLQLTGVSTGVYVIQLTTKSDFQVRRLSIK